MSNEVVVTPEDLAGVANIQTINASVRSLRALKIDVSQEFQPHPNTVKDSKGADVTSGITDLEKDGNGKVVKVGFVNPKDSADKYAKQSFSVADGVLILPGKDEAQVAEINAVIDAVVGRKDTISLAEFDQVLKTMHAYYTSKGEAADIYNSNTSQLDPSKHIKLGENSYQKVARPENMYFVEVPAGETVGFQGSVAKDGHMSSAQFSSGSFVVITGSDAKTGEQYARKLDLGYATKNLRDAKTGRPVDFDAVPKISVADIVANRGADAGRADGKSWTDASSDRNGRKLG